MVDQATVNNALGTILGYLGAEIAPPDLFERLLWPQRYYNGFTWTSVPKMALFMSTGGPLHRAALTTFDNILHNDLLKGTHIGHMLGSPFYADSGLKYTVYDAQARKEADEYVRNDLWTRAIAHYPIPSSALCTRNHAEDGTARHAANKIRAFHKVSYLKLSAINNASQLRPGTVTGDETGAATVRVYAAIFATELIGIVIGTLVLAKWRSLFGILWLVPLILKLISAAFALQREPLKVPSTGASHGRGHQQSLSTSSETERPGFSNSSPSPSPSRTSSSSSLSSTSTLSPLAPTPEAPSKIFEIHNEKHGFLLIEGPKDLILQFFRHYGHPIRNRVRESVQLATIVGMGFVFPVGLVCSSVWMPVWLQYLWLGYQLYTTLAMHIYRFAGGRMWGTTEEELLGQFLESGGRGEGQLAYLGGGDGKCVMAELNVTFHGRYAEGRAHLERLLAARGEGEGKVKGDVGF
ncbi:hypothetical protein BDW74DRAFT_100438 [Aspergillus multicolor]|uniref:uncharacterized protein n=1 Tax=Aspergillus multicolor TaxID=41759 RepID=UPI003CCD78CB